MNSGLSSFPCAFSRAFHTFVAPAMLFGLEFWCAEDIAKTIKGTASPYTYACMAKAMTTIKSIFGLSKQTFNAPLYKLLNL